MKAIQLARSVLFLSISALLLATSNTFAAPNYVQSPPLRDVVTTGVGNVRGGTVQVPLITWGADIATIHANGDTAATTSGSIFGQSGLKLKLVREDSFSRQVEAYVKGESPYLRGTLGMINLASEVLNQDPRTKPVIIYQLSWSEGGDALVVGSGISQAGDLRGKRIGIQAYGPHVGYLSKILADSGLSLNDVTIRWLPDLTATDNSPMAAMQEGDLDAAFVVIPDALALTSGGNVGTGAEDSVRGARILLSTRTANRVIADVYAVRSDYLAANRGQVQKFVAGLMQGQEALAELVANKSGRSADYRKMISNAAEMLLDSKQATSDTEGLYADANLVGFAGNVDFLANPNFPRGLTRITGELQDSFLKAGLLQQKSVLDHANWDYQSLRGGLANTDKVEVPAFVPEQVATVVARKQQQGTLAEGTLFSFEVFFKPNQNQFSADLYQESFNKVIDLASTYGGAIITVEGHSDPMGYLRQKKAGENDLILNRIKQSAKNLSLSRAVAVRESVMGFARGQSINLDPSQFAVVGHGIGQPASGVCGSEPCAPKTEAEWLSNMRVQFRIIQVEAESSVFQPL
jgi:ABC-type nitrate/sulfonate/bicarbonate transport system substrate-binding protein/outer membrane protein OmpA-like peptidoglycan-associated protein